MKRKNLSLSVRDYHSLHWLLYAYLQRGRYRQAEQLLSLMKKVMSESTYNDKLRPDYYENNYASMAAAFVVETERWQLANQLFPLDATTNTSETNKKKTHRTKRPGAVVIMPTRRLPLKPRFDIRAPAATCRRSSVLYLQP